MSHIEPCVSVLDFTHQQHHMRAQDRSGQNLLCFEGPQTIKLMDEHDLASGGA